MAFIRSVTCVLILLIFAFCASIINFFILPIAKIFYKKNDYMFFASDLIHFMWEKVLLNLIKGTKLIKLQIKNFDEIKSIKNKVIVATHPSFIDIVILIGLIPRTTCFVKSALSKNFLLSNIINSIFIPDDVDIEELKNKSKNMLDLGFNVVIFPSGIRHRKNEYPKLKKGASLIALNAHKNISPIKLYSDGEFMFIHKPIYDVDKSTVIFHLEKLDDINIDNYLGLNDILSKKELTKEISKSLYN